MHGSARSRVNAAPAVLLLAALAAPSLQAQSTAAVRRLTHTEDSEGSPLFDTEGHDEYRRIFELFERTLREPGCTSGGGFCAARRATGSRP